MTMADSIVSRRVRHLHKWNQQLWWSELSVEGQVASAQVEQVAVADSIVSRRVSGIYTGRTGGCGGQYCQ